MIRTQAFFNKYFKRMRGSVGNLGETETFTTSSTDKLNVRSGKLSKSLVPNNENNIFKMNYQNGKLKVEFGSSLPYAKIHEEGGFIKTKGKMEGWFWYRYAKTGNPFMRIMALAVRKNGGVNIPERPYFEKGLKDFFDSKSGIGTILDDVIDGVALEWNNG